MKFRPLGATGLKVSVIGFGGIKLPNLPFQESVRVVGKALDLGVNFIDTARRYKDSERKIGEAIKTRREACYIATKTAGRDRKSAMKDLKTSLEALGVDHIDLMQLHSVSDRETYHSVMRHGGALEALKEARKKGWIGHIGVSCHRDLAVMRDLISSGEFETIMVAYSPIDQENVTGIIDLAGENGMGVIAMKPLSGGDLTLPPVVRGERPDHVVAGCLRWVLSNKNVSTAIPGMQRIQEVEENVPIGDAKFELDDQEKNEVFDSICESIGEFGKSFRYGQRCLRCHYCQPCPQEIVIPDVLKAMDMYRGYPEQLKHMGTELYWSLDVKPDACVECLTCVEKCPARLPIPELLKEALDTLGKKSI